MSTDIGPVRGTLIFGILAAAAVILLGWRQPWMESSARGFRAVLWLMLGIYGWLLVGWASGSRRQLLFPMLIGLPAVFLPMSRAACLLLGIGCLAWIRSGLDLKGKPDLKTMVVEILLGYGGAGLALAFASRTPLGRGLGVWLFFLVQALYFNLLPGVRVPGREHRLDAFDRSQSAVESILDES